MTAPTVLSAVAQAFDTDSVNHNFTMPATVNADDILIVTFCAWANSSHGRSPDVTTPSGWTAFVDQLEASGPWAHLSLFAKIADGTEDGASVNFVTDESTDGSGGVVRVQAGTYYADVLANIFAAAVATQSSGEPDPPSLTPGWGSVDTLYGAALGGGDRDTVTGWPTNYAENQIQEDSLGDYDGSCFGQACYSVTASSNNPSTFTVGSNEYVTITWALRGTVSGGSATGMLVERGLVAGALTTGKLAY